MDYLFFLRQLFINNFGVSIKSLQFHRMIIKNSVVFYFFRIIPFVLIKFIINLLNVKYIYLLDNIYFSNYSNNFTIKPMFLSFELIKNNDSIISIKEIIKKYNLSVPLWFLLCNEKLENYDTIKIKFLLKGSIVNKEIIIDEFKDKLLEDLF
jgi:hypothetical protein